MAEEKKDKKEPKKIGLGKFTLIMIGIGLVIFAWGSMSRKKEASPRRTEATQVVAPETHSEIIGCERFEIRVPFGKDICFEPETENVKWWVMINKDENQKYLRPPINSPEYKSKDYGKDLRYVTVWANPGQAYTLNYYFVPASR